MAPPGGKDLTYKVFGLDHMQGEVFADVFAKQITKIVNSLKAIDKSANGGRRFEYVIAGLEIGSAQICFREKLVSTKRASVSPVAKIVSVGEVAVGGQPYSPSSEADDIALNVLANISAKASKSYNYATLRGEHSDLIRVDQFLNRQVRKIIQSAQSAAEDAACRYFIGNTIGTFDGVIEAVDLKGDAPAARLILSAGGKPIDCVLVKMDLDDVRSALGSRVSVSGRAIYEGRTGLPSRLEIRKIRRLGDRKISDLRGMLKNASVVDWIDFN